MNDRPGNARMHFSIVHEQRQDGRWSAQVPEFPKLVAYGSTKEEATEKVLLQVRAIVVLLKTIMVTTGAFQQ